MFNNKKEYSTQEIQDAQLVYRTIFFQSPPQPNKDDQQEVIWTGSQYQSIPFKQLLTSQHSDKPVYYGISTVTGKPSSNRPSSISREDANIHALRAIVLDDIGTKVSSDLISLRPTFIIETSAGNFQYIYVLTSPIQDKQQSKRILSSFKAHRPIIGDLACFTIGRIARLPLGINGKEDDDGAPNQFRPTLVDTYIDTITDDPTTYEWHAVMEGLGVSLASNKRHKATSNDRPADVSPNDDPLFVWLKENMYIPHNQPDTFDGYSRVMCPAHEEHSSGDKYDAGFSPNDVTQPGRQFKCHHAHDGNPPSTDDFVTFYENLGATINTSAIEDFDVDKHDNVKPHFNNAIVATNKLTIEATPPTPIRYNILNNIPYIGDAELQDHNVSILRTQTFAEFDNVSFKKQDMIDAVTHIAMENEFNPAKEYMLALPPHDKTPRAETIFIDNLHVKDSPVHRAITRKWLLAIIHRIFDQGCKFDHALFLTGPEGIGKSSMFEALAVNDDWFASLTTTEAQKVEEQTRGAIIVELGEAVVLNKHSAEEVKHMISNRSSRLRMAYGRLPKTCKIGFAFCGTSNDHEFLKGEQNGVRRMWPLRCERKANDRYDYKQFIEDVPQIYAEVMSWYNNNESLMIDHSLEDELFKVRESAIEQDEWECDVTNFLDGRTDASKMSDDSGIIDRVSVRLIVVGALDADYAQFTRGSSNLIRLKAIMSNLPNWRYNGRSPMNMANGKKEKGWRRVRDNLDSYGSEI